MKPYVKNNRTGEVERAAARRLTDNDLPAVLSLQREVTDALTDASVYVPSPAEEFRRILARGELHGLFAGGRLIAAACFYFPGDAPENHGRDLGLRDEELLRCAVLDSCFVAPDYRGNGLARELAEVCVHRAMCACGAENVVATVSPKNTASLLSLMAVNGMRIAALRQKYGCRLRYILRCERSCRRLYTVYERYALGDVYGISRALADGYEGISLFRSGPDVWLWLSK